MASAQYRKQNIFSELQIRKVVKNVKRTTDLTGQPTDEYFCNKFLSPQKTTDTNTGQCYKHFFGWKY